MTKDSDRKTDHLSVGGGPSTDEPPGTEHGPRVIQADATIVKTDFQPGDIVLVRLAVHLPDEIHKAITAHFRSMLPDGVHVAVLDANYKSVEILRPNPDAEASARRSDMQRVLDLIEDERLHQIEDLGYTAEHDDENNTVEELAGAAAAYAYAGALTEAGRANYPCEHPPAMWPERWSESFWNPQTRRDDLIRGAALIVAALEKLQRDFETNMV